MSEGYSIEVIPESIKELKKAINYDELKEISKRFDNGTETEDDIINHCRNYGIEFENGNQLFVVEKKYFDKVIDLYQKEKEKNKRLEIELEIKKYCKVDELANDLIHYKNLAKEYQGDCVSKDKIREKIKEYHDFFIEYPEEYRKAKLRAVEVVLKELLEENNGEND